MVFFSVREQFRLSRSLLYETTPWVVFVDSHPTATHPALLSFMVLFMSGKVQPFLAQRLYYNVVKHLSTLCKERPETREEVISLLIIFSARNVGSCT